MRDRNSVQLDWRGGRDKLGGVEVEEILIRICCIKISNFNKRKKNQ